MLSQFIQKAYLPPLFSEVNFKVCIRFVFGEKWKQQQEENRKINVSMDQKVIWIAVASVEMK